MGKKSRQIMRSVTKSYALKLIIILILLVMVIYTIRNNRKQVSSLVKSWGFDSTSSCNLSSIESDGWFCEIDAEWNRRKLVYHNQDKRNPGPGTCLDFFKNNWEPTFHCTFEQRIGRVGDGGKWVCDIHRYQALKNRSPLIYSLGSNGDFTFETAIKEVLPQAEIHTFDRGVYSCPKHVCTFHQAYMSDGIRNGSTSLKQVIAKLGHTARTIDLLKVDIEGSEFLLFDSFFKSSPEKSEKTYIRQILFEIHLSVNLQPNSCAHAHRLFDLFRRNHYAITHKEVNPARPTNIYEYALIKLNPTFFVVQE